MNGVQVLGIAMMLALLVIVVGLWIALAVVAFMWG